LIDTQDYRKEFLLKMYEQLCQENSRHIVGTWQSVSIVIGSFAFLSLTEKGLLSLDVATAIIIGMLAWFISSIIDSNYWYNRNLTIIANIERQFLTENDKHDIHHYFIDHRDTNSILTNYRIQIGLGVIIALFLIPFHFIDRIIPGFNQPWSNFEVERILPYLSCVISLYFIRWLRNKRRSDFENFKINSPGIKVSGKGLITYSGHPSEENKN
jgi:hypothetical protein